MKNLLIILVLLFSFIQPLSAKNQSAAVGIISNKCSNVLETIDEVLPATQNDIVKITDAIEAGITDGWQKYTGNKALNIGINRFGESAPGKEVAEFFGLKVSVIKEKIIKAYNKKS